MNQARVYLYEGRGSLPKKNKKNLDEFAQIHGLFNNLNSKYSFLFQYSKLFPFNTGILKCKHLITNFKRINKNEFSPSIQTKYS